MSDYNYTKVNERYAAISLMILVISVIVLTSPVLSDNIATILTVVGSLGIFAFYILPKGIEFYNSFKSTKSNISLIPQDLTPM